MIKGESNYKKMIHKRTRIDNHHLLEMHSTPYDIRFKAIIKFNPQLAANTPLKY